MSLLTKPKYKKYILDHHDIINALFQKHYPTLFFRVHQNEKGDLLLSKTWSDWVIYTYDEVENSIEFVDNYIKKYINFYLFTPARHSYLLDIIKRLGDVDKAENLLHETIKKWYID